MKKILMVLAAFFLTAPLWAQTETPWLDVAGEYAHASNFNVGMSGWLGSATLNLTRNFGVEGDLNGEYGSNNLGAASLILPTVPSSINSRMHSFNVGPNGIYRRDKYDAFGHLLFGFSHTNINASGVGQGSTSFSWVLGGGADYNFSPKWAARFQLDLLRTHFFSLAANHARVGLGVVYHIGAH